MVTPEKVLEAVLAGTVDAGMVSTGVLERAVQSGRITWRDIRVVSQNVVVYDDHRFPHFTSSRTYPGWAVVATEHTGIEVRTHTRARRLHA